MVNVKLIQAVSDFAAEQHKNQCYGEDDYYSTHIKGVVSTVHFMITQVERSYVTVQTRDILYCAAILHDYFEDCAHRESSGELFDILLDHLTVSQVEILARALLLLTKHTGETSHENFKRITAGKDIANLVAAHVKLADASYNSYSNMLRGRTQSKYDRLCDDLNDYICGTVYYEE